MISFNWLGEGSSCHQIKYAKSVGSVKQNREFRAKGNPLSNFPYLLLGVFFLMETFKILVRVGSISIFRISFLLKFQSRTTKIGGIKNNSKGNKTWPTGTWRIESHQPLNRIGYLQLEISPHRHLQWIQSRQTINHEP
jgi:hypothetical protein